MLFLTGFQIQIIYYCCLSFLTGMMANMQMMGHGPSQGMAMPGQGMPGQGMPGQGMPNFSQGMPMPGQQMPIQQMPGQPMPGQTMQGYSQGMQGIGAQGMTPHQMAPQQQPPPQQQQQQKEVNTVELCRLGQETTQEIANKTGDVFQMLKTLQVGIFISPTYNL